MSFETILEFVSVSIVNDSEVIDSLIYSKTFAHAETILIAIELILAKNKISYNDIDLFCTVTGPSSFIKIRVGISVAYGLQFSTDKKVIGINLFGIYENIIGHKFGVKNYLIILNAYQDNFYIRSRIDGNYEDIFINLEDIGSLMNKHENIYCDARSKGKLSEFNKNIIDISELIQNLSVEAGLLAFKMIDENIVSLENIENPKPFYLFDPVFKKKV